MSIFVSIPSIGNEPELIPTIKSVIRTASKSIDIHLGISIVGNKEQYDKLTEEFKENNNIKILFHEYKNQDGSLNIGVAKNRNWAKSLYDGEDYFLQIDSHSRMMSCWDIYLKNKFEKAQKYVNNKKIVLTGTPARYTYYKIGKDTFVEDFFQQFLGVNQWRPKEEYRYNGKIPRWGHVPVPGISDELKEKEETFNMLPAAKICAAFMFGDKYFVDEYSLDPSIIFWEEEIFQSIELIDKGFTLVYPGSSPVVSHLYTADIHHGYGQREELQHILEYLSEETDLTSVFFKDAIFNWNNYMNNPDNIKKIKTFENYNSFSFNEVIHDFHTYPQDYINIGYLPL